MVVQVVVSKVGENAHRKLQPRHAVLLHANGADLHEAVLTALIHHPCKEAVKGDGIHGSVGSFQPLVVHIICNCGQQTAAVAHALEEPVQQRHGGCFAVSSGNTHQRQFPRRMAVILIGNQRQRLTGILHKVELYTGGCCCANLWPPSAG